MMLAIFKGSMPITLGDLIKDICNDIERQGNLETLEIKLFLMTEIDQESFFHIQMLGFHFGAWIVETSTSILNLVK